MSEEGEEKRNKKKFKKKAIFLKIVSKNDNIG